MNKLLFAVTLIFSSSLFASPNLCAHLFSGQHGLALKSAESMMGSPIKITQARELSHEQVEQLFFKMLSESGKGDIKKLREVETELKSYNLSGTNYVFKTLALKDILDSQGNPLAANTIIRLTSFPDGTRAIITFVFGDHYMFQKFDQSPVKIKMDEVINNMKEYINSHIQEGGVKIPATAKVENTSLSFEFYITKNANEVSNLFEIILTTLF